MTTEYKLTVLSEVFVEYLKNRFNADMSDIAKFCDLRGMADFYEIASRNHNVACSVHSVINAFVLNKNYFMLGEANWFGTDYIIPDRKIAIAMYELAMNHGNPFACIILGDIYYNTKESIATAIKYYKKARKLGVKTAKTRLQIANRIITNMDLHLPFTPGYISTSSYRKKTKLDVNISRVARYAQHELVMLCAITACKKCAPHAEQNFNRSLFEVQNEIKVLLGLRLNCSLPKLFRLVTDDWIPVRAIIVHPMSYIEPPIDMQTANVQTANVQTGKLQTANVQTGNAQTATAQITTAQITTALVTTTQITPVQNKKRKKPIANEPNKRKKTNTNVKK